MSLSLRQALAPLLLLALIAARPVAAEPRTAEYMIYQYPDVALVVIVDAREAEFTAQITGPEGALLTEAAVEGRRIGPVWLYVDSTDRPRQLMVHVHPDRTVDRADIGMELIQLSMDDANARRQAQAYRLLAHGMQRVYADDTTTWAQRGQSLHDAARLFAALGMERMRLWAEFYAAHRALHRLDDVLTSLEMTAAIDRAAQRAGFEEIALANEVLAAEALLRGADKATGARSEDYLRRAHAALQALAVQAGDLGYVGEQGRALFRDGAAWERQGELARAVDRYEQALAIVAGTSDTELLNRIRATAAAAYEAQGSTSGAIGLLEAIADDLPAATSADADRAKTLYEKGRLLNHAFRHAEAAAALEEALALQQNDPAVSQWGRTGLELGRALYALGDLQAARRVLLESLPRAGDAGPAERAAAYGMLAHAARFEGRFDEMRRYREQQDALPGRSPAIRALDAAHDQVATQGEGSAAAVRGFLRARDLAAANGEARVREQAELYSCLHTLHGGGTCAGQGYTAAWRALSRSGVPGDEVDARLVYAQILRAQGKAEAAEREMEALLSGLRWYRAQLPGVLGAWRWARRADVGRERVALALQWPGSGAARARATLLALEQLRALDRVLPDNTVNEDLRNRIAVLTARPDLTPAGDEVAAEIAAAQTRYARENKAPDLAFVDAMLGRLERREMLLSWVFGDADAYLLAAGRADIRLYRIGSSAPLRTRLATLARDVAAADAGAIGTLERLGADLLGPVATTLGERVYLLTQGVMNGVPVDALRVDGRYLAERSAVARLASLGALQRRRPAMPKGFEEAVFLAGDPQSGRDPFSYEVRRSEELGRVRERFVGPGLHIVQGVALDRGEFDDSRFAAATLLHLALPGRIDLFDPDRSSLQVAGVADAATEGFLTAPDLRAFRLEARLAVLSNTAFDGQARTAFDGRIGLVDDLHAAGVDVVVASLWPAGDRPNAALMAEFYARLQAGEEIVEAFANARRMRLADANPHNLPQWAGFQLFIR